MSKKSKKIQDQTHVCEDKKDLVKNEQQSGKRIGIAQHPITEAIPEYEKAPTENIIRGSNNSFIVLGRDRPATFMSGYGGKGATQAGRVDLIAGQGATYLHKDGTYGPPCEGTMLNPNFASDAARLYISQKSDIDEYMGLAEVPGVKSKGRSSIALKSDEIRLHARGNIKIVTGRTRFTGVGGFGERLSTGGVNEIPGTISLIAGNKTDPERMLEIDMLDPISKLKFRRRVLQPIPKGDNLVECIADIVQMLTELRSAIGLNTSMIQQMDGFLSNHAHPMASPAFTAPVSSYTAVTGIVQGKGASSILDEEMFGKKTASFVNSFLKPTDGRDTNLNPRFINSNFVFTT
tara:strand:+ start:3275 stop:4318 length:1044 start_codon:yes stop_codon:yes gene_type:complete